MSLYYAVVDCFMDENQLCIKNRMKSKLNLHFAGSFDAI